MGNGTNGDKPRTKYIIVTGGVYSGLGKGICVASVSALTVRRNKVTYIKFDGYYNHNPGTMNPVEHGEVFVLPDGTEADLDFGHVKRFTDIDVNGRHSISGGKLYELVAQKEKEGKCWEGKTIELRPHVRDTLVDHIVGLGKEQQADIVMFEIGGTVGDDSVAPALMAAAELRDRYGRQNVMYVHIAPMSYTIDDEQPKTRPIQHSLQELMSKLMDKPDLVIVRTKNKKPLQQKQRDKISDGAGISPNIIIEAPSFKCVYELPISLMNQGADRIIANALSINVPGVSEEWERLVSNINKPKDSVRVALCGKYTSVDDSYISVREALIHSGAARTLGIDLKLINTEDSGLEEKLLQFDGIIVPGGYGSRGIDGKIAAIRYARENGVPFLGLCYGMQLAIVEYARNVCGLAGAHTTEVQPETPHPVVVILPEQEGVTVRSGTQRLGAQEALLKPDTVVAELYGGTRVVERHRHRYEINPAYHAALQEHGLVFSGSHATRPEIVEFIELPREIHRSFVATQAHPELQSTLLHPAPLFQGFVDAAYARKKITAKE